jgi:hypothetical protein
VLVVAAITSAVPARLPDTSALVVDGASARQSIAAIERGSFGALLLVAAASPFEPSAPLAVAGGLRITLTETIVSLAVLVGATAWWVGGLRHPIARMVRLAACVWLGVLAVAAAAAPADGANAWRFVGRALVTVLLVTLTARVITDQRRAGSLVVVLLASGVMVGTIAVLEVLEQPAVLSALTVFRPGFHLVGGQLRAGSTLGYPTIASMFLEIVFALGLALVLGGGRPVRRVRSWVLFASLTVVAAGVVATFTRAGLLSLWMSLAIAAGLRYRERGRVDRSHAWLAALGLVVAMLAVSSRSLDLLMARFSTATGAGWYGAAYEAPPSVDLRTGTWSWIPIAIRNTGRLTWRSDREPPFAASYHWLDAATGRVIRFDGVRTPFRRPVAPGDRIVMDVLVRAPGQPGCYALVWDLVHETRSWFSTEGVATGRTSACVEGPPAPEADAGTTPADRLRRLPEAHLRPSRLALWKAAADTALDHPILGVGPDNFRHVYGAYLGLATWDHRIHANNTYLELLTGAGLIGLSAGVGLAVAISLALWRRAVGGVGTRRAFSSAVLAAWVAILAHGLVDSFLGFTPTYIVFALALGLGLSPWLALPPEAHAHRV